MTVVIWPTLIDQFIRVRMRNKMSELFSTHLRLTRALTKALVDWNGVSAHESARGLDTAIFLSLIIYKRTECRPSQFGSSRERIAAANAANVQYAGQ